MNKLSRRKIVKMCINGAVNRVSLENQRLFNGSNPSLSAKKATTKKVVAFSFYVEILEYFE